MIINGLKVWKSEHWQAVIIYYYVGFLLTFYSEIPYY